MSAYKEDNRYIIIADWLEKQVSDSSITDGTIRNHLKLSKTTFYRLKSKASQELKRRLDIKQNVIEEIIVQETGNAQKEILKTKADRLLNLQKQIDDTQKDLDAGTTTRYITVDGSVKALEAKLSATEKAILRRTITQIQAEISKIEGDYAVPKGDIPAAPSIANAVAINITVLNSEIPIAENE